MPSEKRHQGDSNPCGQSPMDFESISLTTRTQCLWHCAKNAPLRIKSPDHRNASHGCHHFHEGKCNPSLQCRRCRMPPDTTGDAMMAELAVCWFSHAAPPPASHHHQHTSTPCALLICGGHLSPAGAKGCANGQDINRPQWPICQGHTPFLWHRISFLRHPTRMLGLWPDFTASLRY
jgi:hypothetical protein